MDPFKNVTLKHTKTIFIWYLHIILDIPQSKFHSLWTLLSILQRQPNLRQRFMWWGLFRNNTYMGCRKVGFSRERNFTIRQFQSSDVNLSWAYEVLWNYNDVSEVSLKKMLTLYSNMSQSVYLGSPMERVMLLDTEGQITCSDSDLSYHQLLL